MLPRHVSCRIRRHHDDGGGCWGRTNSGVTRYLFSEQASCRLSNPPHEWCLLRDSDPEGFPADFESAASSIAPSKHLAPKRGFEPLPEALEELPSVRWLTWALAPTLGFEPRTCSLGESRSCPLIYVENLIVIGAPSGIRTPDPRFKRPLLCR